MRVDNVVLCNRCMYHHDRSLISLPHFSIAVRYLRAQPIRE